jgi:hypothetical protein
MSRMSVSPLDLYKESVLLIHKERLVSSRRVSVRFPCLRIFLSNI